MNRVQRSSDVIEILGEKALVVGGGGGILIAIATVLNRYRGASGMFVPLAIILFLIGAGLILVSIHAAFQIRKVTSHKVACPYCEHGNVLLSEPGADFPCVNCHRMIPVKEGAPLPVEQVRCGFCNTLNYFSEKTEVLLCEECNHDIPIAVSDESVPRKQSAFAVQADDLTYELLLVSEGPKHEEMVSTLQQMLAMNRNQVKGILDSLPSSLLSGIPRKKAEILKAQIELHGGNAEFRAVESTANFV